MCCTYIRICISVIGRNPLICHGLLHGHEFRKGHTSVCRGAALSLSLSPALSLIHGFSPFLFFLNHCFICTCLFNVQYEVSASVMLHRFLCKYLCLLLNYYFSSEFPKAFKCSIMMFPLKNKSNACDNFNSKMLLRVQTSGYFLY